MRRVVLLVLILGACTVSAWGKTFQMDRRGDAVVKVDKVGGEYKVTCTFSPQTKFEDAINAKFNDARGDSLCKRGLARYLNVGTNDLFTVSGLHLLAPVKQDGDKLRYSFAVPVDGCKVEVGAAKPKVVPQPVVTNVVPQAVAPSIQTNVNSQVQTPSVQTNAAPQAVAPSIQTNAAPQVEKTVEPAAATNGAPAAVQAAKVEISEKQ